MRAPRRVAALGCVVALALALTGCGDDAKEKAAEKKAGAAKFETAAEKICTKYVEEIKHYGDSLTAKSTQAEIGTILDKIGDGFLAEVAALRKLDPPSGKKAAVEKWLDAFAAAAEKTKQEGVTLLDDNATSPFADPDAKVKKLGLDGCLSGAS